MSSTRSVTPGVGPLSKLSVTLFMTAPSVWRPYSLDGSIYVLLLAPALCAAVVLVQYSMRRIGISIALLITMVAAVTVVVVIDGKTSCSITYDVATGG